MVDFSFTAIEFDVISQLVGDVTHDGIELQLVTNRRMIIQKLRNVRGNSISLTVWEARDIKEIVSIWHHRPIFARIVSKINSKVPGWN